jgi:hypothetical protein
MTFSVGLDVSFDNTKDWKGIEKKVKRVRRDVRLPADVALVK